jgi:transposase
MPEIRFDGPELATLLVREAFSRPISNRRALGSYAGLAGTPFSSGASKREQGIGKEGNRRVRAAMVELAWLWLRWQPDSTLSAWFRERVGKAGGRIKKISWHWPASFSSPFGVTQRTASFRRERR